MEVKATGLGQESLWLLDWFDKRSPLSGTKEEQLKTDFFAEGLIDSFGVIELILAVETEFGISLNERHFQDRRFKIIEGLSEIIAEIRQREEKNLNE